MKALNGLSDYLGAIEKRLRWIALTRGAAVTAAAALLLTIVAVVVANRFAFSNPSVVGARVFLFLGLAFAIAAALIIPVIRLNRRRAAHAAESKCPQFEERLLTFTERMEQNSGDPFLPLLADDALAVAQQAKPHEVAKSSWIFSFSSAALAAAMALIWLGVSGPGFLGYGTSLLWGGLPKGEMKPFYSIQVDPGNRTIRKRADLMVTATLMGFSAPKVRFFAKYASASQWEQAEMRTEPGGSAYQFMIAGVPETLDYYVEAGGVRSQQYKLSVIDLPSVKKIRVTYHYPSWIGLPDATEDPGGDLRAVEGTNADVFIETDRPLNNGELLLDDGSKVSVKSAGPNTLLAKVPIQKDGMYHIAALESGEDVRLTNEYFIEAMKDNPPEIRVTRPGRDFRATPIEEVTIAVEAKDDFGLKNVDLHYSVNGGPDKAVSMLQAKGAKTVNGTTVLSLEDFKIEPGDIVSLYATAKDARQTTNTDMFFIEAQPFERNYSQSQEAGGGGGGGGDDAGQQNEISQRQKEIITATWNQVKGQGARGTDAENANFLSGVQAKLRDQAKSLAERMKARALEDAGDSFKSFVKDMEQASEAMGPAADKLKAAKWHDALEPEQKALQYILRAEATFRDIQVAFGRQSGGGGGGGGGATRDMEGLFDLELDTEKNQYEGARQTQSADARQREVDDALQKLAELARRQQELAEQQKKGPQTTQQRWEQEQLRREAEQLRQRMEQMMRSSDQALSRNGQQQQGQSQSGQQQTGSQSQSGQGGQQSQQNGQQQGQPGQPNGQQQNGQMSAQQRMQQQQQAQQQNRMRTGDAETLRKTLDQLQQATQQMRDANSSQAAGTPQAQAGAQRALESLRQAQQMLNGMRSQQSTGQVDDIVRKAEDLARKQQEFEGQLRRAFGKDEGLNRQQAGQMADQRQDEINQLKQLEQEMQNAVRDLASTQRQASSKMRDALGQMQQQELPRDMQRNADWIRRGMGEYAVMSESQITAGMNDLRDHLQDVQKALGAGAKSQQDDKSMEKALADVEAFRKQLEQLAGQRGQQQGQGQLSRNNQQGGRQQGGQQQGANQQGGQQQGGQQQGGQQAGGRQQGGQQQGGQQQGGNQQGGQQAGGQQQGGNQQGGQQQGGNQQAGSPQGGNQRGGNQGGAWNGGYGGPLWDHGGPWGGRYDPQALQGTYRDTIQSLQQLQQQLKDDPGTQHDIQGLLRDLRNLNPADFNNDPLLNERINAALANVEQVEMELRRKVDDSTGGGSVRSPGSQPVPQGYSEAVAEYFRKLSKSTTKK